MTRHQLFAAAAAMAVLAFTPLTASSAADPAPDLTAHRYGTWGFDLAGRDTAIRPGDNFFGYANAGYLAHTEIPADQTWYGTVILLRDLSEARVHAIVEDEAAASTTNQPTDT